MKRRILFLISSLVQGGAQRHLLELVRLLDPAAFEVAICTLDEANHFGPDLPAGQPAYCLRSRVFWSPAAFARLVEALRSFRPDILHCYLNDGNLWGSLASRFHRPRALVTSVHLDDMSSVHRFWERRLNGWSDRIVAHSRSIERLLVRELDVPPGKVTVIANGVDVERFPTATEKSRAEAREVRGIAADAFVAVMPARIARQKNQDLVLEALGAIKREGGLPSSFRLLLAGGISSRSLSRKVDRLVALHGLGSCVARLGPVKDVPALLRAADVVLLPSRTEASPIAALEALSVGVPVLISDAANTDGVVVPGEHGWQVTANDVADLQRRLREVFASSSAERARLGRAGRAHVAARFTNRRVADDFTCLYDELVPGDEIGRAHLGAP
jgi:glycosyltransferase involved in cell wall biosynthesis